MTKVAKVPGALLADAGRLLYGEEWAAPLARALKINARTVQRWREAAARGDTYLVSLTLLKELAQLLEERPAALLDAARKLKALPPAER